MLLQWGGNWCGWCIKLHELCQKDPELKKELLYEYDVVHVDAGQDKKNMDLAESYGAKIDGFPYLTILDSDGKPVVNQSTPPSKWTARASPPVMTRRNCSPSSPSTRRRS